MKALLITFAVLLLLLTLLSTFGGSIRPSEAFYQNQSRQSQEYFYEDVSPPEEEEEMQRPEQYTQRPEHAAYEVSEQYSQSTEEQQPYMISEQFKSDKAPAYGSQQASASMISEQFQSDHAPFIGGEHNGHKEQMSFSSLSMPYSQSMSEGFTVEPFEHEEKKSKFASF